MERKYLAPEVSDSSEVLHLKLWDGTVHDYSGSGVVSTLVSAPPYVFPGIDLDGVADYINTNNTFQSTFRGSFTISFWIKPDDGVPTAVEYPFGCNNAANEDSVRFAIINDGTFAFIYESNNIATRADSSSAVFSNGQETWHNITCVADSTKNGVGGLVIYVDGSAIALGVNNGNTSGITFADYTSTVNLVFGAYLNGAAIAANSYVAGLMDDIRLYSAARTASQIRDFYEQTRWRYGV